MPNLCDNRIVIVGPSETVAEVEKAYKDGRLLEYCTDEPCTTVERNTKVWGTKWEIQSEDRYSEVNILEEGNSEIIMGFTSAWTPPIEALTALKVKYPLLTISGTYFEPGCAFAGYLDTDHGVQDTQYEPEDPEYREIAEGFGYGEDYYGG